MKNFSGRSATCIVAALTLLCIVTGAGDENREFEAAHASENKVLIDLEQGSLDINALDHGADLLKQWHEDAKDGVGPPDQAEVIKDLSQVGENSDTLSFADSLGGLDGENPVVSENVEIQSEDDNRQEKLVERDGVTEVETGNNVERDVVTEDANPVKDIPNPVEDIPDVEVTDAESHNEGSERVYPSEETQISLKTTPIKLDDYRKRTLNELHRDPHCGNLNKSGTSHVKHRLETGGEKYNFAAASHGAKLVSSNKEAKGAGNILNREGEKYYRSPCSAEDKFVVIELSEETLVDTFVVANYEFYSSNLKEFELLGSLNYPTENWTPLGKFAAENARHAHVFQLQRPEWVRYLKLQMISHYNTDFFCTLSMVEVYGIDAIECLMEEWFGQGKPGNDTSPDEPSRPMSKKTQVEYDGSKSELSQASRLGDSVLKVLMQKVKALELNQTLFEQYVDELISNYRALFGEIDNEMSAVKESVQNISSTLSGLTGVLTQMKDEKQQDWNRLQFELSKHVDVEAAYVESLRLQMQHMQNREMVALTLVFLLVLVSSVSHILARCFKFNELNRLKSLFFWVSCLIATVLSI